MEQWHEYRHIHYSQHLCFHNHSCGVWILCGRNHLSIQYNAQRGFPSPSLSALRGFSTLDAQNVKLTGDQTVAGNKTFSNIVNGTNGFSVGLGSDTLISRTDSDGNRLELVQENNNENYYISQYRPLAGATDKTYQNIIFPNKAGTFALTSDVNAIPVVSEITFSNVNNILSGIKIGSTSYKLLSAGSANSSGIAIQPSDSTRPASATGYVSVGIGANAVSSKQNKLTAGTGIIIDSSNKISADVSTSVSAIDYNNDNVALTGLALNGVNYKLAFPGNAKGNNSLAIGYNSTASTPGANAYGASAAVTGNYGIAIGTQCTASGSNALTIGINGIAKNDDDIAIGGNSVAQNGANVALGVGSHAYGNNSIAIGDSTFNNISNTVTFDTTGINRNLVVATPDNIVFRNFADLTKNANDAKTKFESDQKEAITAAVKANYENEITSLQSQIDQLSE
jgi:hypothetical protein